MRCVLTGNYTDKRCGVAGWVAVRLFMLTDHYTDKRCRVEGCVDVRLFRLALTALKRGAGDSVVAERAD